MVKKGNVLVLMEHLNQVDNTENITFTFEEEKLGPITMLDIQLTRKKDGRMKVKVYRKKTHTNQYLSFSSHHPWTVYDKLGVVQTILDQNA